MYFKKLKGKFKIQKTCGMAISDAFILRAPTVSRNPFNTRQKTRPLRAGLNSVLFKYKKNNTPRPWCYRGTEINITSLPDLEKKTKYKLGTKKNNQFYTPTTLKKVLFQLKTYKKAKTSLKQKTKREIKKKKSNLNYDITNTEPSNPELNNEINIFKVFTLLKKEIKYINKLVN